MILFELYNTIRRDKYTYALIDSYLTNYAHINQRRSISYHSIISSILKNIENEQFILFFLYYW